MRHAWCSDLKSTIVNLLYYTVYGACELLSCRTIQYNPQGTFSAILSLPGVVSHFISKPLTAANV